MSAAPAVLRVQGLSFSYPRRHVFTDWSADFAPGLTWLRGHNGSGKSTLLKLLAGALPPLAGELSAVGAVLATQPLQYRREVFWCGPGAIAFDHLHMDEYFGFMQTLYPRWDADSAQAHARAFGLEPYRGRRLQALSTGTQRKVWLSAALAAGTRVVLLDEPMNALDAASLAHLRGSLAALAQGPQAVLAASHEAIDTRTVVDLAPPAA